MVEGGDGGGGGGGGGDGKGDGDVEIVWSPLCLPSSLNKVYQ